MNQKNINQLKVNCKHYGRFFCLKEYEKLFTFN